MKTLKFAFIASLALAFSLATRAASPAQHWLEYYYAHPEPAAVPRMIQKLAYEGYFEQADHRAIAIGFLATVFQQNPGRIDGWMYTFGRLPLAEQRLVASALWQAGDSRGAPMLRSLARNSPVRSDIEELASRSAGPITAVAVQSPDSMNLQWGAFLASGDARNIVAILDAIGTGRPGLDEAARYTLAQNAASHPRVLEICRDQLAKEPDTAQAVLRSALQDAAAKSGARS
jgi:hypothetical protein